ncbi:hypothetical protein ACS0TY_006538 [Phlomoides rotata]
MIFSSFPQESASSVVHEISEMESLSSKFLISSSFSKFPKTNQMNPPATKLFGTNSPFFSLTIRSKKSSYQDFQEYVKPLKLLPATDVKELIDASSVENAFDSSSSRKSDSLYKIKIQTSNMYGSGLSDVNSGVLLCLIDENGSSILRRLPATSVRDETLHFQRGSSDEFAFEGPNLGRIVAIWIGLESGEWRIGGISLSVVSPCRASLSENNQESKQINGLLYKFEFDDILLGEKSEASMMEFRPQSVAALSDDESTLFYETSSNSSSNEDSMKEYAYLKFSLLFYDTVLILAGFSVASILIGENGAYAFLMGGLCGFLYLLFLQKSVDELPSQELKQVSWGQFFKSSISSLVLAFAIAIIVLKYASGDDAIKLTPKDLIFGMMGFLMCKVSVLLAAFKPLSFDFRDNKQGL